MNPLEFSGQSQLGALIALSSTMSIRIFKSWVLLGLIGMSFSSLAKAEPGVGNLPQELPPNVLSEIYSNLSLPKMLDAQAHRLCSGELPDAMFYSRKLRPEKLRLELNAEFVTIPEG